MHYRTSSALSVAPAPFVDVDVDDPRVVLVGSGVETTSKLYAGIPAEKLYCGKLFRARRDYALTLRAPWAIVSLGGLLLPDEPIMSAYDARPLAHRRPLERAEWMLRVADDVLSLLPAHAHPSRVLVEVMVGSVFAGAALSLVLQGCGFRVEHPVAGLGVDGQIALLKARAAR